MEGSSALRIQLRELLRFLETGQPGDWLSIQGGSTPASGQLFHGGRGRLQRS